MQMQQFSMHNWISSSLFPKPTLTFMAPSRALHGAKVPVNVSNRRAHALLNISNGSEEGVPITPYYIQTIEDM